MSKKVTPSNVQEKKTGTLLSPQAVRTISPGKKFAKIEKLLSDRELVSQLSKEKKGPPASPEHVMKILPREGGEGKIKRGTRNRVLENLLRMEKPTCSEFHEGAQGDKKGGDPENLATRNRGGEPPRKTASQVSEDSPLGRKAERKSKPKWEHQGRESRGGGMSSVPKGEMP